MIHSVEISDFTLMFFLQKLREIGSLAYKSYLNSGNLISRNIFQVRVKFWFFHTVWAVWQYHLQFAINCFFFVERWITFCRIWSHSDFSILTCYTYRHLQCSKYKQYFFKKSIFFPPEIEFLLSETYQILREINFGESRSPKSAGFF